MNEYTKGAFECLSWIEAMMSDKAGSQEGWESLEKEIGEAITDIRRGIGVDFRERLRSII